MVNVDRTTPEYEDGFARGYEKGRTDGEASAGLSYHRAAREEGYDSGYKEALMKGFERGCAVTSATGMGYATGVYTGDQPQFRGRWAQLVFLGSGEVRAKFLIGEDWETKSNLFFNVEEWEIDQDSVLEIPDAKR